MATASSYMKLTITAHFWEEIMINDRKRDHPTSPGDVISQDLSFLSRNLCLYSEAWTLFKKPEGEEPDLKKSTPADLGDAWLAWCSDCWFWRQTTGPSFSVTWVSFVILGKPLNSWASVSWSVKWSHFSFYNCHEYEWRPCSQGSTEPVPGWQ